MFLNIAGCVFIKTSTQKQYATALTIDSTEITVSLKKEEVEIKKSAGKAPPTVKEVFVFLKGFPLKLDKPVLDFMFLEWEPIRILCVFKDEIVLFQQAKEEWIKESFWPFSLSSRVMMRNPCGGIWKREDDLYISSSCYKEGIIIELKEKKKKNVFKGFLFPDNSGKMQTYEIKPNVNYFEEQNGDFKFHQKYFIPPYQIYINTNNELVLADNNASVIAINPNPVGSAGCQWRNYIFASGFIYGEEDFYDVFELTNGKLLYKASSGLYPGRIISLHVYENSKKKNIIAFSLESSKENLIIAHEIGQF